MHTGSINWIMLAPAMWWTVTFYTEHKPTVFWLGNNKYYMTDLNMNSILYTAHKAVTVLFFKVLHFWGHIKLVHVIYLLQYFTYIVISFNYRSGQYQYQYNWAVGELQEESASLVWAPRRKGKKQIQFLKLSAANMHSK
jgi:hypothetical protein